MMCALLWREQVRHKLCFAALQQYAMSMWMFELITKSDYLLVEGLGITAASIIIP